MPTAVLDKQETKKVSETKRSYKAPVAVYESSEAYVVLVELPGADEKAIQVRVEKGVLTVQAPLKLELPSGAIPKYSEIRLGDYVRTFDLGDQIDEEKIDATFKAGLLKLTMPKGKNAKARKIPIKTV
ncbi:MAG: Hsp20/alpha crystallin family protein [Cyanobacteria bacterium]|nr:Hsp20/alpha crystallin family protein [Cyanobacteriota bacterium]